MSFDQALGSFAWLVHADLAFRMLVDAETHSVHVEIVNAVEMLQEGVSDQEQILVFAWQAALVDHEEALAVVGLVQVLLWVDFEHVITHLESYWLHLWSDVLALVLNVAEGGIGSAVKIWNSSSPLVFDFLEHIGRDTELTATSVDDCWVGSVFSWLLHWLGSVVHSLSLEGPSAEPVFEVFEGLESGSSVDDLTGVISTEKSIWSLTHFIRSNTKTHHSSINNTVIFERPQVVEFLLAHVLVGRQAQNTVRIMAQSFGLVQRQKLEESALVVFQLHLQLHQAGFLRLVHWLQAGVVVPDESLKLG